MRAPSLSYMAIFRPQSPGGTILSSGPARPTPANRIAMPQLPVARPTILLVDDDEMLRRALTRALDYAGFKVLQAGDGQQALTIVRRLATSIALVVTDINMPVMNGFDFARAMQPLYSSVPILFMTGALPQASTSASLRDLAEHLLLKPFGPDVFLETVRAILDIGSHARRTHA
jgi:DNA-binding response OmpR family regulator